MLYVVVGSAAVTGPVAAGLLHDGHDVLVNAAYPAAGEPVSAHVAALADALKAGPAAADIAGAQAAAHVLGCLWAARACAAMLAAAAVTGRPVTRVLDDPGCRPLLAELARQVLAGAPVPPAALDGFDPADLAGAPGQLAGFYRRSGISHSGIYRDLAAGRHPTEVPALLGGLDGALIHRLVELVQAIERGGRSCAPENLDLLAAYERLERLGRPLNAVASVIGAPERAEPPAGGGPLAGRPVAVKDIIAVAGVPTRCGSPASDPGPACRDADLVDRLRAAGAEVFATTQCLEYAAGFAHPEIGDTRNPRDPSRTSGGSSGGSAAVVAAGVCDLALGTDTGGSVRIPAAYCGVVGFKPTYGLLPLGGVVPLSPACDHAGTLTAAVAGAAELLAVLAGPVPPGGGPGSPGGGPGPAGGEPGVADGEPGVAGGEPGVAGGERAPAGRPGAAPAFTVGVLAAQLADPSVTPEVRDAVCAALGRLAEAGWEVRELADPWLDQLPAWEDVLTVIVAREAAAVHAGRDTSRYAEGTRALLAFGASVSDEQYAAAAQRRAELTAAIEASLAGLDVLAGPTVGYQAPEEDPPFGTGEDNGEGRFTGPYNLSGHPAVSIPVPAAGLPAGLQLASRLGGDWALLQVAAAAESLIRPAGGK